jgi:hypothetical protein
LFLFCEIHGNSLKEPEGDYGTNGNMLGYCCCQGQPDGWTEFDKGIVVATGPQEVESKRWLKKIEESIIREYKWDLTEKIQIFGQRWGNQISNRRDRFWK